MENQPLPSPDSQQGTSPAEEIIAKLNEVIAMIQSMAPDQQDSGEMQEPDESNQSPMQAIGLRKPGGM